MSCLEEQREFCAWLEDGEGVPWPGVERARLAVHRNTFVGTLVEAMAESFPVLRALSGAAFFDAMARARVLAQPPRSPVLTDYLVSFPEFVARFEPAQPLPLLAEMARLEALRLESFHAADAEAIGLAEFHRLACDAALFETTGAILHPAARWLSAAHPLVPLWRAHVEAEDMSAVDLSGIDISLPQDVLVHRPRFEVLLAVLPAGALAFLDALAAGASFSRAFAQAQHDHADAEAAALFSLLLKAGLVVELLPISPDTP